MILVTGGTGQLGAAFGRLLPDAEMPTRADLDLARGKGVTDQLDPLAPDVLINCAAYTAVDAAETDIDNARAVNADAVGALAGWCADSGARFVTFSTDYVFDGSKDGPYVESDSPHPRSVYGLTKLEGERAALAANPNSLIVRTSWVISGTHPNFVATMLRLSRDRRLRVVDDQHGCPTIVDDLAPAVLEALELGVTGLLHLVNAGPTTWFELARSAVRLAGRDPEVVQPCGTDEFPRPAPRPANSVLASERASQLGLTPIVDWRQSLPAVVAGLETWV